MKRLLIATTLVMLATTAHAGETKTYKKCVKDMQELLTDRALAKHLCDPNIYVKPNELGWGCEEWKITKDYPGGAKSKRDALCE